MAPMSWHCRARSAGARLGQAVLNLVYPPQCGFCGSQLPPEQPDRLLCPDCSRMLAPETWVGCRRCGAQSKDDELPSDGCPQCKDFRLYFDQVSPLGAYAGGLRQAVLRMKQPVHELLSLCMAGLLAERRGEELVRFHPNIIVPVPMHWWRRWCRGVNSAEVLAEGIGQRLGVSVARRAVVRCRYTWPQKDLSPRQRFKNVHRAFRLRRGDPSRWKGSHVLLVDDILTTGATCSEVARVLKEAGAAAVAVTVLARA